MNQLKVELAYRAFLVAISLFCCSLAADKGSYLFITNNSPYTFVLRGKENSWGYWLKDPLPFIAPYSEDSPILKDKSWSPSGSEGELTYDVILGEPSLDNYQRVMVNINLHFIDPNSGDNEIYWNFAKDANIHLRNYTGNPVTWFASFYLKGKSGDSDCRDDDSWVPNGVPASGSPICIRTGFHHLQVNGADLLAWLDDEYVEVSQDIRSELFATPSDFDSSLVADGFIPVYNCIAYTINDATRWYDEPLIDDKAAVMFYGAYGFDQQSDCSTADIVLYCIKDQNRNCVEEGDPSLRRKYTHGARSIQLATGVNIWWSKLGQTFLMSHNSQGAFSNQHYGSVAMCFKRRSADTPKLPIPDLSFPKQDVAFINSLVSSVSSDFCAKFEKTYQDWQTHCLESSIMLSSFSRTRAEGSAFRELVQMGQTNRNEFMPLLIAKLMQPEHFMAVVLFEDVKGYFHERNKSLQEVAHEQVNHWLNEHKPHHADQDL